MNKCILNVAIGMYKNIQIKMRDTIRYWWDMCDLLTLNGLFFFFVFFISCDPHWDLNQSFSLSIDSKEIPVTETTLAFQSAISQLGGNVSEHSSQTIHIRYDKDCKCSNCSPYIIAYVEPIERDTIHVCPKWFLMKNVTSDYVLHELGHVLGPIEHMPCATETIMSSFYGCRSQHTKYTLADIQWICGARYTIGGACTNPNWVYDFSK